MKNSPKQPSPQQIPSSRCRLQITEIRKSRCQITARHSRTKPPRRYMYLYPRGSYLRIHPRRAHKPRACYTRERSSPILEPPPQRRARLIPRDANKWVRGGTNKPTRKREVGGKGMGRCVGVHLFIFF